MNEVLPQEIADRLTDFLCDYSSVKPYLFIQVINQDNHTGELERLIYRSHYEFAITCHIGKAGRKVSRFLPQIHDSFP